MKRFFLKLRLLATAFLLMTVGSSFAQLNNLGDYMQAGVGDAEKLLKAYLTPYGNILGANLNGGWYTTAKVHKTLGFDVTFSASVSFAPTEHETFDINTLGLEKLKLGTNQNNIAPTVAGDDTEGSLLSYSETINGKEVELLKFNSPKGTGYSFLPMPALKAGIGLPKGTELMVKFLPTMDMGDAGEMGLWGLGLKHDILQWLPLGEWIPIVNVSIMGAYTKLSANSDINYKPVTPSLSIPVEIPTLQNYDNQKMEFESSAFTTALLISADLPFFSVYGGVGFSSTSTKLKLTGDYEYYTVKDNALIINSLKDPIDISIDNEDGITIPRFNIGARLKFAVLTLHLDYVYSSYSMVTTGIGITFR